jgi:hypothetical protein
MPATQKIPWWEAEFVGRENELQELFKAWHEQKQIFGIYGIRSVGKTRLVEELLNRLRIPDENVYRLDYTRITTLNELIQETCDGLKIERNFPEKNWTKDIALNLSQRINNNSDTDGDLVVFIRHYEDVDVVPEVKNEFAKLCDIVKSSRQIRVIFTSTLKIRFARMLRLCKSLHLWRALSIEESKRLMRDLLKDSQVHLGKHEDVIIKHCLGIPFALMVVGKYSYFSFHPYYLPSHLMAKLNGQSGPTPKYESQERGDTSPTLSEWVDDQVNRSEQMSCVVHVLLLPAWAGQVWSYPLAK